MEKLNINEWAEEDRPREKLMRLGVDAYGSLRYSFYFFLLISNK